MVLTVVSPAVIFRQWLRLESSQRLPPMSGSWDLRLSSGTLAQLSGHLHMAFPHGLRFYTGWEPCSRRERPKNEVNEVNAVLPL